MLNSFSDSSSIPPDGNYKQSAVKQSMYPPAPTMGSGVMWHSQDELYRYYEDFHNQQTQHQQQQQQQHQHHQQRRDVVVKSAGGGGGGRCKDLYCQQCVDTRYALNPPPTNTFRFHTRPQYPPSIPASYMESAYSKKEVPFEDFIPKLSPPGSNLNPHPQQQQAAAYMSNTSHKSAALKYPTYSSRETTRIARPPPPYYMSAQDVTKNNVYNPLYANSLSLRNTADMRRSKWEACSYSEYSRPVPYPTSSNIPLPPTPSTDYNSAHFYSQYAPSFPLQPNPVLNGGSYPIGVSMPTYNCNYTTSTSATLPSAPTPALTPASDAPNKKPPDKKLDIDVREYLATWDDDADDDTSIKPPDTPIVVLDCTSLEGDGLAQVREKLKGRSVQVVPSCLGDSKLPYDLDMGNATIVHVQHTDLNVKKDTGKSHQPLDFTKSIIDNSGTGKSVKKAEFEALVSYYGDAKKDGDCHFDLAEITERFVDATAKVSTDEKLIEKSKAELEKKPLSLMEDPEQYIMPTIINKSDYGKVNSAGSMCDKSEGTEFCSKPSTVTATEFCSKPASTSDFCIKTNNTQDFCSKPSNTPDYCNKPISNTSDFPSRSNNTLEFSNRPSNRLEFPTRPVTAPQLCSKPNNTIECISRPATTLGFSSKPSNSLKFCNNPINMPELCNKPVTTSDDCTKPCVATESMILPDTCNKSVNSSVQYCSKIDPSVELPVSTSEFCSKSSVTSQYHSKPAATSPEFSMKSDGTSEYQNKNVSAREFYNKPVTTPESRVTKSPIENSNYCSKPFQSTASEFSNLSDLCNKSVASQELCTNKPTVSLDYCNKQINDTEFYNKSVPEYRRKSMDSSDYSSKPTHDLDTSPYFKKRKWYHSYCNDNQETPINSSTQYTETNYFFDKRFESSCSPVSCPWESAPADVKTAHSKSSDLNLSTSNFLPHKTSFTQDEDNIKSFTKEYLIEQNKVLTQNVQISPIKGNPLMSSSVSYTQIVENGILKNAPVEDNNFVSEDKRTTICDSDYSICRNPVTKVEKIKDENKNNFDPLLSSARRSSYKSDDLEENDKKSVLDDCETDENPGDYISHEIGKDDDNLSFFCENSFDEDAIDDLKGSPNIMPNKPSVSSEAALPIKPETCKVSKIKNLRDMKKISLDKKENITKMRDFRKKKPSAEVTEAANVEPKETEIRKPIKITVQKTKVRVKSKENEVKYRTQFKLKTSKDSESEKKEAQKVIKKTSNSSSSDIKGCAKNKKIKPMKKLQPVREETTCQKLRKFKFKLLKQSGVLGFPKFPNPNASKIYDFPESDEDKKHKEQRNTKISDVCNLKETPKPDSVRENLHESKTSNMLNIELDEICDSSKLASSSEHLVSIKSEIVSVSSSKCASISSDDSLSTAFLANEKCSNGNEGVYKHGQVSMTTGQSMVDASREVPFSNPALFQDSNATNQDLKQKYFESQKLSKNFQLVEENLRRLHGESSSQKSMYASNEVETWSCAKPIFFERTDFKNVNTLFCNTSSKPAHYQENLAESSQLVQQTGRDSVQETNPDCMYGQPYFDQTTVQNNNRSYYGTPGKHSNYVNPDYLPKYTENSRQNQMDERRDSDLFNLNNFDQNPFLKADSNLTYFNHNMHKIDREIGIREIKNGMQYFNRNGKSDLNETNVQENVRSQDTFTEKQSTHKGDGCDFHKNVTEKCKNIPSADCDTSKCKDLSAESTNHCVNLQSKILEIKKECLKTRESVDLIFNGTKEDTNESFSYKKEMRKRQLSIEENSSKNSECLQNDLNVINTEPGDLNHSKREDSFENFDGNDKSSDHYLDYFVSDSSITEEKTNTICDNILGKDAEMKECSDEKTNPSETCPNSGIDNEPSVLSNNSEPNLDKDFPKNCQSESIASTDVKIHYITTDVKESNLDHHPQSGVEKEFPISPETLCKSGDNHESTTRNLHLDVEVDVVEDENENPTKKSEVILGSSTNQEPHPLVLNSKEYESHKSESSVSKVKNAGTESVFSDKANIFENIEPYGNHSSIPTDLATSIPTGLDTCLNKVECKLDEPTKATSNECNLVERQTDFLIGSERFEPASHFEKIDPKEMIFLEKPLHQEKINKTADVSNTIGNKTSSEIEINLQLNVGEVSATIIRDKQDLMETITCKVDASKVQPEILNDKDNFTLDTTAKYPAISSTRQECDQNSESKDILKFEKQKESSEDTIDKLIRGLEGPDLGKCNRSTFVDRLSSKISSVNQIEFCDETGGPMENEVINESKELNEKLLKHEENVSTENVQEASHDAIFTLHTKLPGHKKSEEKKEPEHEVILSTEDHSICSPADNQCISSAEQHVIFPTTTYKNVVVSSVEFLDVSKTCSNQLIELDKPDKFSDDDVPHFLTYDDQQCVKSPQIDIQNVQIKPNDDQQNEPNQLYDSRNALKLKEKQNLLSELINDNVQRPKNECQNVHESNERRNKTNEKKNEPIGDKQKNPRQPNDSLNGQHEIINSQNKLSNSQYKSNSIQHVQIQQINIQNKSSDNQNGTRSQLESNDVQCQENNNQNVQHKLIENQEVNSKNETYPEKQKLHCPQSDSQSVVIERLSESNRDYEDVPCQPDETKHVQIELNAKKIEQKDKEENGIMPQIGPIVQHKLVDHQDVLSNSQNELNVGQNEENQHISNQTVQNKLNKNQIEPNDEQQKFENLQNNNPTELNEKLKEPNKKQNETEDNQSQQNNQNVEEDEYQSIENYGEKNCLDDNLHGQSKQNDNQNVLHSLNNNESIQNVPNHGQDVLNQPNTKNDWKHALKNKQLLQCELNDNQHVRTEPNGKECSLPREKLKGRPTQLVKTLTTSVGKFRVYKVKPTTPPLCSDSKNSPIVTEKSNRSLETCQESKLYCNELKIKMTPKDKKDIAHEPNTNSDNQNKGNSNPDINIELNSKESSVSEELEKMSPNEGETSLLKAIKTCASKGNPTTSMCSSCKNVNITLPSKKKESPSRAEISQDDPDSNRVQNKMNNPSILKTKKEQKSRHPSSQISVLPNNKYVSNKETCTRNEETSPLLEISPKSKITTAANVYDYICVNFDKERESLGYDGYNKQETKPISRSPITTVHTYNRVFEQNNVLMKHKPKNLACQYKTMQRYGKTYSINKVKTISVQKLNPISKANKLQVPNERNKSGTTQQSLDKKWEKNPRHEETLKVKETRNLADVPFKASTNINENLVHSRPEVAVKIVKTIESKSKTQSAPFVSSKFKAIMTKEVKSTETVPAVVSFETPTLSAKEPVNTKTQTANHSNELSSKTYLPIQEKAKCETPIRETNQKPEENSLKFSKNIATIEDSRVRANSPINSSVTKEKRVDETADSFDDNNTGQKLLIHEVSLQEIDDSDEKTKRKSKEYLEADDESGHQINEPATGEIETGNSNVSEDSSSITKKIPSRKLVPFSDTLNPQSKEEKYINLKDKVTEGLLEPTRKDHTLKNPDTDEFNILTNKLTGNQDQEKINTENQLSNDSTTHEEPIEHSVEIRGSNSCDLEKSLKLGNANTAEVFGSLENNGTRQDLKSVETINNFSKEDASEKTTDEKTCTPPCYLSDIEVPSTDENNIYKEDTSIAQNFLVQNCREIPLPPSTDPSFNLSNEITNISNEALPLLTYTSDTFSNKTVKLLNEPILTLIGIGDPTNELSNETSKISNVVNLISNENSTKSTDSNMHTCEITKSVNVPSGTHNFSCQNNDCSNETNNFINNQTTPTKRKQFLKMKSIIRFENLKRQFVPKSLPTSKSKYALKKLKNSQKPEKSKFQNITKASGTTDVDIMNFILNLPDEKTIEICPPLDPPCLPQQETPLGLITIGKCTNKESNTNSKLSNDPDENCKKDSKLDNFKANVDTKLNRHHDKSKKRNSKSDSSSCRISTSEKYDKKDQRAERPWRYDRYDRISCQQRGAENSRYRDRSSHLNYERDRAIMSGSETSRTYSNSLVEMNEKHNVSKLRTNSSTDSINSLHEDKTEEYTKHMKCNVSNERKTHETRRRSLSTSTVKHDFDQNSTSRVNWQQNRERQESANIRSPLSEHSENYEDPCFDQDFVVIDSWSATEDSSTTDEIKDFENARKKDLKEHFTTNGERASMVEKQENSMKLKDSVMQSKTCEINKVFPFVDGINNVPPSDKIETVKISSNPEIKFARTESLGEAIKERCLISSPILEDNLLITKNNSTMLHSDKEDIITFKESDQIPESEPKITSEKVETWKIDISTNQNVEAHTRTTSGNIDERVLENEPIRNQKEDTSNSIVSEKVDDNLQFEKQTLICLENTDTFTLDHVKRDEPLEVIDDNEETRSDDEETLKVIDNNEKTRNGSREQLNVVHNNEETKNDDEEPLKVIDNNEKTRNDEEPFKVMNNNEETLKVINNNEKTRNGSREQLNVVHNNEEEKNDDEEPLKVIDNNEKTRNDEEPFKVMNNNEETRNDDEETLKVINNNEKTRNGSREQLNVVHNNEEEKNDDEEPLKVMNNNEETRNDFEEQLKVIDKNEETRNDDEEPLKVINNNEKTTNYFGEQLKVIDNNEETRNDDEEPLKVFDANNEKTRNDPVEQLKVIDSNEKTRNDEKPLKVMNNNKETRNDSEEQLYVIGNNEETRNNDEEPLKVFDANNEKTRNDPIEQLKVINNNEETRNDEEPLKIINNNEETRNDSGEQFNVIVNNEETRNDHEEPLNVIHNNHDESRNGNDEQLLMAIEDNVKFKIIRYEQTRSKDLLNYELVPESSERLYNMNDSQNSVTAIIQDNECEVKTTTDLSDRLTESNKRDYNIEPESFGPESSKTDKDKLDVSEPSTVNTQPNQVGMDSHEQRTCTESSENHITKESKSSATCEISQGKILTNHDQKKHVFRDLTSESKRTSPERKETKRNPKLSKYKDFIAAQKEKRKFMRKGISKADAEIISSQTGFSYGLRERKVKDLALQENRRLSLRINSNLKRKNTDEVQSSNEKKRKSMPTKINKNVHAIASEAPVGQTSESLDKNHEEKSNEAVKDCTSDSNLCTVITNGDTIFIQLKSQSDNIAIYDAMQSDCYVVIDNDHLMNETPLVIFDETGEQVSIENNTKLGTHITEPHVEPNKETPPTLKPFYEIKNIHENVKSIPVLKPEHLVESDENRPNAETQSKSMLIKAKKADTENVHDSTRSNKKKNKVLASPHPSSDIKKPRLGKKSSSCKTSPKVSQHIQQENQGSDLITCENAFSVDIDCKENLLVTERHETVPENTSSRIKENDSSVQKTVSNKETSKCTQRIKNKRKLLKSFDEDENMNKIIRTDETTKPDINATEKILDNLENEKKKVTKVRNQDENKSTTKAKRKYFEINTNGLKCTNHIKDSNPSQIKSKTHELPPNKFVCLKKQEKENKSERSKEGSLNQKHQEVAKDKKANSTDKQPIGVKYSKTPPERNIDSKKTPNSKSSLKKRLNAFDANLSLFKSDDRDLKSIKKIIKKTGNKIEKPPETEVKKSESSDSSLDLKIKSNEESKENTTNDKLDENKVNNKVNENTKNINVDENTTNTNVIYTTTDEKDAEELLEKMVSATLIPLPTAKNSLCITEKSKCSEDSNTPPPLRLSEKEDYSKYEQVIENNQKMEIHFKGSNVSNDIELRTKRPMDAIEKQDEVPDVCADTSESHVQNDTTQGNDVFTEDGISNFNNNNKRSTSDLHNASLEINLKTNSQTCNEYLSEEITETTISENRSCSSEPKTEDPFAILIKEVNNELKNAYNYSKQVVGFDSPLHHNVRNLLFNKRNNMNGSPKPYYDEVRCAQEIENILLSESRSLSPFSERMLKANNENPFGIENPEEYFHHDIDYSRKTRHWQVRDTSPTKHTPSPPIILGENRLLSMNSPIGQQNLTHPMLIRPNIILDDLEIPNEEPDIAERCKPSTSTTEESFVPILDLPNKEKWVAEPEGMNHSFDVSTEIEQNQLSARIELPSFSEIALNLNLSGTESFAFGTEKLVVAESITEGEKFIAPKFETESTECEKKDEVEDTVVDEQHTEVQYEHLTESSTQDKMIQASIHDTPFIDETQRNTTDTTLGDLCYNQENIALNKQLTIDEGFTQTICEKDGAPTSDEDAQTLCENPLVTSDNEILDTSKLVTDSNSSCGVPDYLDQDKEIVDQDIQSDEESPVLESTEVIQLDDLISVVESTALEKENDSKTNSEVAPAIDAAKEFKVQEGTPAINETVEISNSQKTTEEDEMLISSIMDWPYLEEEVVTQNDEDKINAFEDLTDLRIKLPWSKIFDLKDSCDSESVDSQQGSLELGPVEIKLQLNSFQTSSLKVKRLILQKAHSESSDRDLYDDIKTNQPSVALNKEDLIEEMLNNQVYCIKLQDIVSCDFCGKQLLSQDFLSRHLRHLHELHSCPACDEQFSGELSLLAHTVCHKQRHHCLLCNKVFSSDKKFKQHENSGSHRQLESVQRQTIHILYKYLSGRDCTSLEPLSTKEVTQLRWYPSETRDDTINYYHPTPLHQVLQENLESIDNDTPSPSPCSCDNADCDGNTCNKDC